MVQAFQHHGVASRWQILAIDREGLKIESAPGQ
jgi:hypothetical protein